MSFTRFERRGWYAAMVCALASFSVEDSKGYGVANE